MDGVRKPNVSQDCVCLRHGAAVSKVEKANRIVRASKLPADSADPVAFECRLPVPDAMDRHWI